MLPNMILMRFLRRMAPILMSAAVAGGAMAQSQSPTLLGESGDWQAYTYKSGGATVCYVVSQPKSSEPKAAKRDPVFFLVTHRPAQKIRNEVSTIIGYPFKKDSKVDLSIDGTAFTLFTNADGAWADTKDDKTVVDTMKKGQAMTVKGTSWRGTSTTDTYSLKGISAALDKIDSACN
jgi:invasion protein IalB